MKKIGICACYNTLNYGSMLQAFATQVVIDELGYESEFLVYKKSKNLSFIMKQVPRLLNRNLLADKFLVIKKKILIRRYPEIQRNDAVRVSAFRRFQQKYYRKFSPVYYGYDALCSGAEKYDSVLVGSDQLWTPGGLASNFYNLMFVPEYINKISYGTSFGVDRIPWYQKKRTQKFLSRINYLAVREIKGAEIVKNISGRYAQIVVDPTLLLTKEKWEIEITTREIVDEPYIFCYFLGENEEHRKIAEELKNKTGIKIVCTPHLDSFVKNDVSFGDIQLFNIGPDDFVNLVRNAEFVLTDSFHGSVFSLLHHKKFLVLNRYNDNGNSRNSRIDSLCELLSLEKRRYRGNVMEEMNAEIDYETVDEHLSEIRENSLLYLRNSLERK